MIPALRPGERPGSLAQEFLVELRLRGFEGDIAHSHADRTVFATDNSIYQLAPQAIVSPRNDTDVVRITKLANEPRFRALKFTPRGGGTGTNGQSLTDGVCVDLSRHMNAILEINTEEGWARVQAGVVKDQLNDAVAASGLFFAPELSPSSRATIGGMIATDASGQGSVLYGKTRDHVIELRAIFMDGTEWQSRPMTPAELETAKGRGDRVGHVLRVLDRIRSEDSDLIAERFPKLNRCVTGYDITEFRAALDRRGLVYGMFGHVDAGCLHVRPALDMKDPSQEKLVREISDEVFELTRKYKGVLWGEHGKGFRSEYVPEFFGPLYPRMQEIKAAFDPHNQLNPGKIAAPPGQQLARIDGVPTRGQADRQIPIAVRSANEDSLHCNGNAACFNWDPDDAMCPSWKATRDRKHSPKGRASLMREWLRLLASQHAEPQTVSRPGDLLRRAANSWRSRANAADFSHEVKEAMDGCLACKSCVGQCPIKVDVPAFRSRFLEAYYGRYLRPLKDHFVARLESFLPYTAGAPRLFNAIMHSVPGQGIARGLGLVALPELSTIDIQAPVATPALLNALTDDERRKSVVVVQDAFTTHYDAPVVRDWIELLRRLGFAPWLAPFRPNGKPQHVLGLLRDFKETASRNARMLQELADTGVSLVGLDPSMTLTYRAEYVKVLGQDAVPEVALPQEWLARRLNEIPRRPDHADQVWQLLAHCTERTNAPAATSDWVKVANHLGVALKVTASGCCGMAGLYGHERANRASSEKIYGLSWGPIVAASDPQAIVATGYSCRCQVKLIDGVQLRHPVQVILRALS